MRTTITFLDTREVEIDDDAAAQIAEQLIRERFKIGDATEISPDGRLRTWHRDGRGKPEATDGKHATPSQRAAVIIATRLRR